MKKLVLVLLLIPLVSFGQDKITVIDSADFDGYDLNGNYINKIEKIEVIKDYEYFEKIILWKNAEKKINKWLDFKDYLLSPFLAIPYTGSELNLISYLNITDENYCSYAINYKYFTSYDFLIYDGKDEISVNYGLRLLKPNYNKSSNSKWYNINTLFYKKNVKISNDKTVIENLYNIAVKFDNRYKKFVPMQIDLSKYFYTTERNQKYDSTASYSRVNSKWVEVYDDPVSLKKNNSLKKQLKQRIWINVDDKITLGDPCKISQTVYDKNHIITLNDDFDFSQKIENGKSLRMETISDLDHTYVFTLGLEDPSKSINDFDVENAIEYRIRYISKNSNLKIYKTIPGTIEGYYIDRRSGTFMFEVKKKIKGVFYYENKMFSGETFGDVMSENYDYKKSLIYNAQRKGLIKIFRSSDNIIFSLNNNLIDKTENHFFENNTILMTSFYNNSFINGGNFRPYQSNTDRLGFDMKISKTINKRIPLNNDSFTKKRNNNQWAGNGSGIIISKLGHIVTNHHVIQNSKEIEIEFILNDEVQKFNAEIVQVDKTNDLAVLKIVDVNFDGLVELPYNFKTRSSDVGTKVYAYGYPMALSLMGKEIKITDGIISSKSGFDGDIRTYQITAPIQSGNSGGPLFDDKGNFIGINSTILKKEIAENVGYTIKSNYVLNLIDVLPKSIDLPSNTKLQSQPITEQIKEISKYVVLIKVK